MYEGFRAGSLRYLRFESKSGGLAITAMVSLSGSCSGISNAAACILRRSSVVFVCLYLSSAELLFFRLTFEKVDCTPPTGEFSLRV